VKAFHDRPIKGDWSYLWVDEDAMTRFGGAILPEQDDEWAVQRSRYMALESVS